MWPYQKRSRTAEHIFRNDSPDRIEFTLPVFVLKTVNKNL